jgi:hypothetical protein
METNFYSLISWKLTESDAQRAGIADGGEIDFRPPGTAAWLFDKVKYLELKLGFVRQAPNRSTAEIPLLIVLMSSPTIGNTNVVRSLFNQIVT